MPLNHPKFKAAAVQAAPAYLDLEATVAKTIDLIAAAARGDGNPPVAGAEIDEIVVGANAGEIEHRFDHGLGRRHIGGVEPVLGNARRRREAGRQQATALERHRAAPEQAQGDEDRQGLHRACVA